MDVNVINELKSGLSVTSRIFGTLSMSYLSSIYAEEERIWEFDYLDLVLLL